MTSDVLPDLTYMTVEEPCAWIIRSPPNHDFPRRWDRDCVPPSWILLVFNKRRVDSGVVGSDVETFADYLELVSGDQLYSRDKWFAHDGYPKEARKLRRIRHTRENGMDGTHHPN